MVLSSFMWGSVLVGVSAFVGLELLTQTAAQFGQSLHDNFARKTLKFETVSLSGCDFLT